MTPARSDRPSASAPALADDGPVANSRITGSMGLVLLVLLAAEGATVLLGVGGHLSAHVFIGMLVVPPIAVKTVSTGYRIVRYYQGDRRFVARGAPPLALRALGPLVVVATFAVVGSGIGALVFGRSDGFRTLHKLSFVVWFAVMTIHVLGHVVETPRLAFADWRPGTRSMSGASARRLLVLASLVAGVALGWWSLSWIGHASGHVHLEGG